jgi:hypothetical protein
MDGKVLVPSNTSLSSFFWDECVEQKRFFD